MRPFAILLVSSLLSIPVSGAVYAQMASPPPLDYVPVADDFKLPPGMNFGGTSGVAINSKGNIFVLHRGPLPLMEFDAAGNFIRGFGEGLFDRPHGLRIDAQDNIWATDVGSHVVYKFSPQGRILIVLGVRGRPGDLARLRALAPVQRAERRRDRSGGEIFVVQGHGKGEPRVLKFDRDGNFIKPWGRKGKGTGEFDLAHSVVVDEQGPASTSLTATTSVSRCSMPTAPSCANRSIRARRAGCFITPDQQLWLAHGHTGLVLKLDLNGTVLGAMAGQGKALGQFGEAHYIAVSAKGEIYVADTLNWRVQKFVKK